MSEEVPTAPAAAAGGEEPPKKKRKSRFGDAPPAAAAEAAAPGAATATAAAPSAPAATGVSPLLAAQQALQGSGLAGPATAIGPTPGGGANAIPLGGGPGFDGGDASPKSTIKPGPERLVGAKELRGLDPAAAVAAAAPKADFDDLSMMGPAEDGVITEVMKIPNEAVGLVIGRSGETIRQLQIRAGADIQVSRDQGEERGIVIQGPAENVAMAKSLVNQIVSEKLESITGGGATPGAGGGGDGGGFAGPSMNSNETQFLIPQRHVGLVIGSGGQQIRQLQDQSGARIQVAKDPIPGSGHPLDQRQVTLSGDPSCVATAKGMIETLMANDPRSSGGGGGMGGMGGMPGAVKKVIEIPNQCVGGVIGAQGRQIKYMQETSGAHIQMQKNEDVAPGATMREVTVEGQQGQVDLAVQLIQREVEQQQNRSVRPESPCSPAVVSCFRARSA